MDGFRCVNRADWGAIRPPGTKESWRLVRVAPDPPGNRRARREARALISTRIAEQDWPALAQLLRDGSVAEREEAYYLLGTVADPLMRAALREITEGGDLYGRQQLDFCWRLVDGHPAHVHTRARRRAMAARWLGLETAEEWELLAG